MKSREETERVLTDLAAQQIGREAADKAAKTRRTGAIKRLLLDDLPIFADDAELGQALLGTVRAAEWLSLVPIFERQGFPKIDPIMGGRYVPAVKAFFDRQYGLSQVAPTARDGIERPEGWNASKRRG